MLRLLVEVSGDMAVTPAQVDLWRQEPTEHQALEFKEAKASFNFEKLKEYCVAIANEGGGHLLLGVSDKKPREVVGSQAFQNPVDTADKLFRAVGFRVEVDVVAHDDGRVIVFTIPTRPRGSAYHLDGKYLMRSGESLTPMSEDRLRAIFAEGQPDWVEQPVRHPVRRGSGDGRRGADRGAGHAFRCRHREPNQALV